MPEGIKSVLLVQGEMFGVDLTLLIAYLLATKTDLCGSPFAVNVNQWGP